MDVVTPITTVQVKRGTGGVKKCWTRRVVGHKTGLDEEREQGVKMPRGDRSKNRRMLTKGADLTK